jgi:hypothetical protein
MDENHERAPQTDALALGSLSVCPGFPIYEDHNDGGYFVCLKLPETPHETPRASGWGCGV